MNVKDAKRLTHDWVLGNLTGLPGFEAAFYHGSINWLNDDAPFPPTSDIDIIAVVTDPGQHISGKRIHQDLILEVSYMPVEAFQSAEQILGTFYLAGSFRKPGIITDKKGHLTMLQHQVTEEYAAPYWIRRRCQDAQERSLNYLEQYNEQAPLHDQVTSWLFARGLMAHMLLVSGLKNPTVRKRYVEVQKLLSTHHLLDFHDRLLYSIKFAHLSPSDVERHLTILEEIFDTTSALIKTPYRFASDISSIARPITIDGSHELIRTGFHREAMFWIIATHCRCQHVLCQDAPRGVQQQHNEQFSRLLQELGIATFKDREQSNSEAFIFLSEVRSMAEKIMTPFSAPTA